MYTWTKDDTVAICRIWQLHYTGDDTTVAMPLLLSTEDNTTEDDAVAIYWRWHNCYDIVAIYWR